MDDRRGLSVEPCALLDSSVTDTEQLTGDRKFQGVADICASLLPGQWLYMATCLGLVMLMVYLESVAAGGVDNVTLVLLPCVMTACYCLLYTSPSPRDGLLSRMPSSA